MDGRQDSTVRNSLTVQVGGWVGARGWVGVWMGGSVSVWAGGDDAPLLHRTVL